MKRVMMFAMLLSLASAAPAAGETTFDAVLAHYEPIRQALLGDSMEGVNEHGAAMARELRALDGDFNAGRAGTSGEALEVVRDNLDAMIAGAEAIAGADSLEAARDGFYALTKPMVSWRQCFELRSRPVFA
mgnify:CR=1 FL=1